MDSLHVALLRGVNVGGVKVLMQPLRAMCEGFGWTDVRTYIASGNVMFRAQGEPRALAEQLKSGLAASKFGKVIIGSQWTGRNMNTVRKLCQWAEDDRASAIQPL